MEMNKGNLLKVVLLGLLIIALVIFVLNSDSGNNSEDLDVLETEQEVIGFSAMSSVSALESTENVEGTLENQNKITFQNDTQRDLKILNNMEDIDSNLGLVNTFMGENKGFEVEVLDNEEYGYEHAMAVNSVGLSGEEQTHTFYYNETIEDGNKSKGEYESSIDGIMILEESVYNLSGELEVDEGEKSFEMTAKKDEENYVNMDYEFEEDTNETSKEFEYELFEDDEMVKSMEIEFEQEEGETEMSLTSVEGDYEVEYDFEREEEDGEIVIEIEYEISEFGEVVEQGEIEVIITPDGSGNEENVTYRIKTEEDETEDEETEDDE